MTMDILDNISELNISLKKEAAILNSFMNEFTNKPKQEALLAIETDFETFQYTAHVIADLLHEAQKYAGKLEAAADEEWKTSPHKCG